VKRGLIIIILVLSFALSSVGAFTLGSWHFASAIPGEVLIDGKPTHIKLYLTRSAGIFFKLNKLYCYIPPGESTVFLPNPPSVFIAFDSVLSRSHMALVEPGGHKLPDYKPVIQRSKDRSISFRLATGEFVTVKPDWLSF
jgi:hypothetical protein